MTATTDRVSQGITSGSIQTHYDLATPFYWLLWGSHIHHGYWEAEEAPETAQIRLIERMVSAAEIRPGMRVLDVGCGMGGTSIHLAKVLRCRVTGLTLSPLQRLWATASAWWQGVGERARFRRQDAERARFRDRQFDIVWSVECTEHLFDKAAFFRRAADWLKPGGRLSICAWLAGDKPHAPAVARKVQEVCEGFLCPSLGTQHEYLSWFTQAGLEPVYTEDITAQVARTWEICLERVNRRRLHMLARWAGADMRLFLDRFATILDAYRTGAMKYGCFVARKP